MEKDSASSDYVAVWDIPLSDEVHHIEFQHGTTSGRRVVRVDGKEIIRREWMFKLVGDEVFNVGNVRCVIKVMPVGSFSFSYELLVNDKSYECFTQFITKAMKTWLVHVGNETYRVVLEKDTLDIWVNGRKIDATGEFVEDGTETHFTLGNTSAYIKAVTSGKRREGIIHNLIVNGTIIAECLHL